MLNNFDIERGFLKREEIEKLLYDFQTRVNVIDEMDINGKVRAKLYKGVHQTIAIKLLIVFQRQIQLDLKEAKQYYNSHHEKLNEMIDLLFYILDYINDIGITYIPDKLTIASYFRINAEVFDFMMNDVEVDEEVQRQFRMINEFILSLTQTGLETAALNSYAWQRLQLQSKFGGHEIAKPENQTNKQTIIVSSDIQRKLQTNYDFTKMIAESESKESNKEG